MAGLSIAIVGVLLLAPLSSFAQTVQQVAAAKKEGGKVVLYTSMETFTADAIKKAFEAKTGLQMEYWRGGSTEVMDRVLAEHRVGKPVFDVVATTGDHMHLMAKEGAFASYESPSLKGFARDAVDPVLGARYRNVLYGVIYNKNGIRASEAPRTLTDVVRPAYRGKLVMPHPVNHTLTIQWLASLDRIMPKPRAEKFIRDLAAARPVFVESIVPAADRVGTGETPVGITFVRFVLTYNRQGANLDWVRDYRLLGDGQYICLGARAPRPNAGKAFIDFFLDDESMNIQAQTGEFVNRRGIHPPLPDADKIEFVQMHRFGKEDFEVKKKEYRKIFLQ
ncbi:MAG TPA: extracellular solute-binding protein [candidate division Zixibacteria bacterium]|nr:extracellular solute-binding protein [candidate division Zixibacteria bacterium]